MRTSSLGRGSASDGRFHQPPSHISGACGGRGRSTRTQMARRANGIRLNWKSWHNQLSFCLRPPAKNWASSPDCSQKAEVVTNSKDFASNTSTSLTTNPLPALPPITVPMASRRLALNLAQGMRSRAAGPALRPLKRGFATPVASPIGAKTQTTTLKNGLTVSSPPPNWPARRPEPPSLTLNAPRSPPSTRPGPRHRP